MALSSTNTDFTDVTIEDELDNNPSDCKAQLVNLMKENEQYKQEIYSLHCKLEVSAAIHAEMREGQEILETTANELDIMMKKKIQELNEKHVVEKRDFISRLSELEGDIIKKCEENESLQVKIQDLNKKLQSCQTEVPIIVANDTTKQKENDELLSQLRRKDYEVKELEEYVNVLSNECEELKNILATMRNEFRETKAQLENVRSEAMALRLELTDIKEKPASESLKGNSLFAEVEDRRKKMLDQMTIMKKNYSEVKRMVNAKDAEIKLLKSEKTALLRKWEDDKVDACYRDAKLLGKYKERITELEEKLQKQIEKINKIRVEMKPSDNPYSFFQTMMNMKDKDIEKLEARLEFTSIHAVLQEEMTHKLSRQSRSWRRKALCAEAQLEAIKSHVEDNPQAANAEVLQILNRPVECKPDFEEEELHVIRPSPELMEESMLTFEQLKIPNLSIGRATTSGAHDDSLLDSLGDDAENSFETPSLESNAPEVSPTLRTQKTAQKSDVEKDQNRRRSVQEIMQIWESDIIFHKKDSKETKVTDSVPDSYEDNLCNLNKTDNNSKSNSLPVQEKKTVKFAEDTAVPSPRTLRRQATPRYPIQNMKNYEWNVKDPSNANERKNNQQLKSVLAEDSGKFLTFTDESKKEKKTLKFTEDTVDLERKVFRRQTTPKYPIIYISNERKK